MIAEATNRAAEPKRLERVVAAYGPPPQSEAAPHHHNSGGLDPGAHFPNPIGHHHIEGFGGGAPGQLAPTAHGQAITGRGRSHLMGPLRVAGYQQQG